VGLKRAFVAVLVGVCLAGCKGNQQAMASSDLGGDHAATKASAAAGSGTRTSYISDPSLNMNAVSIQHPSGWTLKGVLVQGGKCFQSPMAVYRTTSSDGQSMEEQMPGMAWMWGTGPMISTLPKGDCLPLTGPMSAQDFTRHLASMLKVDYVGLDPVPSEENARAQQNLQDSINEVTSQHPGYQPPKGTRDLARGIVKFQKGAVAMKGRIDVTLDCTETNYPGQGQLVGRPPRIVPGPGSVVNKCMAKIRYYTAPESQYAAMVRLWNVPGYGEAKMEPQWKQAYIKVMTEQTQKTIAEMDSEARHFAQGQQQQFNHDQAVRQVMNDQFIQSMNEQGDRNLQQFKTNMAVKDAVTSDYVDYSLDRRTVQDTTTGVIYKQSVTDPLFDNQQQVHGNGTQW
jgi:hypothetical protein